MKLNKNIRSVLSLFLIGVTLITYSNVSTASSPARIVVNGVSLKSDSRPFIDKGVTYAPIRPISESLDGKVNWNNILSRAEISHGDTQYVFTPNSNDLIIKSGNKTKFKKLKTTPRVINGRTYLPVREYVEAIGYNIEWQSKSNLVVISGNKLTNTAPPYVNQIGSTCEN